MSMGGSKTQTTEIPQFIEDALRQNIDRGESMSRIGYKPYYGPTVAGMNDLQKGAMRNTSALARGLGMGGAMWNDARQGGIRPTQDFGNGMQGYSSGDMFDQALAELQRRRPGQYQAYADMFIDPQSGAPAMYDQRRAIDDMVNSGIQPELAQAIVAGDGDAIESVGQQLGMSGEMITKLRSLTPNPFSLPGLAGYVTNAIADYYAGSYGREGSPGLYSNDMFYRADGVPTPVRGSDFYSSSEAETNRSRHGTNGGDVADDGGNSSRGFRSGGW